MTHGEVLDLRWLRSQKLEPFRVCVTEVCEREGWVLSARGRVDAALGRTEMNIAQAGKRNGIGVLVRLGGSDGVDMVRIEIEDVDAKRFVPARTPLLTTMRRWVILSND